MVTSLSRLAPQRATCNNFYGRTRMQTLQRQKKAVLTRALMAAQSASLEVALDFYKILQVSHVASRESATRAFERAVASPPEVGYSQATLLARGSILKGALDTLLDPSARRDYDERLLIGDVVEEVPSEYVAGVLSLLEEAGEAAAAVAAGEPWLAAHNRDSKAGDVALALALARCDLAAEALEAHGEVIQAVAHMEAAASLLQQYRPGAELLGEVQGGLGEMQPQLALALCTLPLDPQHAGQRARGLEVAAEALRSLDGGGRKSEEFVQQLTGYLTSAEHVRLYDECGSAFAESPGQLYDVAIALIAEGAAKLSPGLLQKAVPLLLLPPVIPSDVPEAQRERRVSEERNRRAVALAVCCLLLGDPQGAESALGLQEGASARCDRAVLQFIKANSPDRADLLPGLCVLAQRWVHDVAFASFRSEHDVPFSLDAWFAAPQVQKALKAIEAGGSPDEGRGGSVGAALERVTSLLASPFVGSLAGVLWILGLLETPSSSAASTSGFGARAAGGGAVQRGARGPAVQGGQKQQQQQRGRGERGQQAQQLELLEGDGEDMSQVDLRRSRQAALAERAQQAQRAAAAPAPGTDTSGALAAEAAEGAAAPTAEFGEADGAEAETVGVAPEVVAAAQLRGRRARQEGSEEEAEEFASQPIRRPPPLAGEEWMAEAYQTRYVRWGRIAGAAAVVLVGGLLLARAALQQRPPPAASSAPLAAVAASMLSSGQALGGSSSSGSSSRAGSGDAHALPAVEASLSKKEAAALVKRWQRIKSEAMGPKHASSKLESVLHGPLLAKWQEQAAAVQEKGWHYTYSLEACTIGALAAGSTPGTVSVTATLREGAKLFGGKEVLQQYRNEYSVTYELVKEGGQWKLCSSQVQ